MRFFLLGIFVLFANIIVSAKVDYPSSYEDVLSELDEALDNKEIYVDNKLRRVDSLLALVGENESVLSLYEEIGEELRLVSIDSAVFYYERGFKRSASCGDTVSMQRFLLLRASVKPIQGVVRESVESFDAVSLSGICPGNEQLYYMLGNRLYFYVSGIYPSSKLTDVYVNKGIECTDSLLVYMEIDSPVRDFYEAQCLYMRGNTVEAVALLDDVMRAVSLEDNLFARAASMRASLMQHSGERVEYLYYLALSALSDVRSGTREATSLQRLGVELYTEGDVPRAYAYLMDALDNAVKSGARVRMVEASHALPIISQSFRSQDDNKLMWLSLLVALLALSLVALGWIAISLRKEKVALERMRKDLLNAYYSKEVQINQILNLCSAYMEQLAEFNKVAVRKITAGQVEDLYKILKTGKIIEEQRKLFLDMFDGSFMRVYPRFIEELNELLLPDRRVSLTTELSLTPELRIIALMRLGVVDGVQISRFTGLSVNTIYTYRTKIKSRALNRETFESDVMHIGVKGIERTGLL